MTQVEIARGGPLRLVSYGNGDAYALYWGATDDESIFVQGDDATTFREEWEALEAANPNTATAMLLQEMRNRYS